MQVPSSMSTTMTRQPRHLFPDSGLLDDFYTIRWPFDAPSSAHPPPGRRVIEMALGSQGLRSGGHHRNESSPLPSTM